MTIKYPDTAPLPKWWRLKYRFKGNEKRISLGTYPSTGLRDARDKRDAARRQLAAGIDVSAARKAEKAAEEDTLEAVAREWHKIQAASWDKATAERTMRRLQAHVFPSLGSQSVAKITVSALLAVLRNIEHLGTGNVVQRIRGCLGRCSSSPSRLVDANAIRPKN